MAALLEKNKLEPSHLKSVLKVTITSRVSIPIKFTYLVLKPFLLTWHSLDGWARKMGFSCNCACKEDKLNDMDIGA